MPNAISAHFSAKMLPDKWIEIPHLTALKVRYKHFCKMLKLNWLITLFIFFPQLPSKSLLWRAILQVILLKHKPNLNFDEQHVGRIASKCVDFEDYVVKSFKKLGFELKVSIPRSSQCGNFIIFLSLRFYVKSFSGINKCKLCI